MSDALSYLLKVRPDAMGHYFAFLKEAGRPLDPKTKALISVITKVHGQTERGLRQYVKRALDAGCSAPEIIDALLIAFPALGLTKIVWAVDVLLAMKLPEFEPERMSAPQWRPLAALKDIPDRTLQKFNCAGRGVFVYRDAGECRVFDERCPHQGTHIPLEALANGRLVCPKHGWTFDPASGECIANGTKPLRRLEARLEGGIVLTRI